MHVISLWEIKVNIWNWEQLEPGWTQSHISGKPGECLNHLDHWVHSFPVTALHIQELIGQLALTAHSGHICWGNISMWYHRIS